MSDHAFVNILSVSNEKSEMKIVEVCAVAKKLAWQQVAMEKYRFASSFYKFVEREILNFLEN